MKRFLFPFFLILFFTSAAQKQGQALADSLLQQLSKAGENFSKLDLYVSVITAYNDFNRNEARKFEQPAMELAEKLGSQSGIAAIKNAVGRIYWRDGKFGLALKYHNDAKAIFERLKDDEKLAVTIRYIGQDYADGGDYPEAMKNFRYSLDLYEKLDDVRNKAYIYELIAWVYRRQGNYVEASKAGFKMINLFETFGEQKSIAAGYSEIGENYIHLGNYAQALKYFEKSGEVFRATGNLINQGYNHNLVGKVYCLLKNYAEAEKNHHRALELGKEVNDVNVMGNAYDGMAEVDKARGDLDKALEHYLASAELFKQWSNRLDLARVDCKIGECYRMLKDFKRSREYYAQAFSIANDLKSAALIADYYHGLERLDSVTGNWKDAYLHHKTYTFIKDSIFNEENVKQMVQIQLNYEFDKKEAATKAEQEVKDARQRKQFLSIVVIAALIFMLAIVMYRNQKRIARINLQLKQKSDSLEEENREKNSILNIVSHDLRAPFNKIKGLTNLMEMAEPLTKEEKDEYIAHIKTTIDQGNHLINNLLESQKMQHDTPRLNLETVDVAKFIHDFQLSMEGQLLKKQQRLQTQLQLAKTTSVTDALMLTRILDNLVSNASKFSANGKSIYMLARNDDKNLIFSVRDEGPGISDDDQKKMFRKFQMLSARPTAGEGSTGLGLSITKALVEKLNGTIQVNSRLGEGTEVIVSFPA